MWISKLILNPRSAAVRRDIANPYEMHRTLMWALGEEAQAGRERVLWRVESRRLERPVLLVQTLTKPAWEAVLNRYPRYADVDPTSPKAFDPQLVAGQVLRFRLRANPSVKRQGKRLALLSQEEKMNWLERKMKQAGCELRAAAILSEERVVAYKAGTPLTVFAVLFEGLIQVTEPAPCYAAIERGVGAAKGLGMGLLSVARGR